MGDRVSIQFEKNGRKSVTLFSHWGGMDFVEDARNYVAVLREERKGKGMNPLDRLEPETVMVDFIRYLTKDDARVESNLYLGVDENDGDNSDNGNHILNLD
jgi:hypothetical protein